MKPIGSVTTGLPHQAGQPASSTGRPHGETGSAVTSASQAPALSPRQLTRLGELSTVLSDGWMKAHKAGIHPGNPIYVPLTRAQLTESGQLFRQAMAPAPIGPVAEVIKRMLAHYSGKDVPDTVAEDWLRHLQDKSFGAIWLAYERQITSNDAFAPKLGQFLERVSKISRMFMVDIELIERCKPETERTD